MNAPLKKITVTIIIPFALFWLLTSLFSKPNIIAAAPSSAAQANPVVKAQPVPTPTMPVARPCGRGEQMQPWVVCLYGVVTENGTAVDGALVKVTAWDGRTVSATTAITRSLERLSNYGIDLSQLDVDYLDTITVTASYQGKTVSRQLLVYPDFYTQNQRHDFILSTDNNTPFSAPLWGYVYIFGAIHPVSDIQVSANFSGNVVTTKTTQQDVLDPYPFFAFSAADFAKISPSAGNVLTLTASYQGIERQIHLPWNGKSQQANLLWGWQCDDDGVLPQEGGRFGVPQEGGRFGVPQEGGRFGVPDEACFWGYTLADGNPVEGMQVQLTVNGETYSTLSRRSAAEELPHYAIRVPSIDKLAEQTATYIATFGGAVITSEAALSAGFTGTQQLNLNLQSLEPLGRFVSGNDVNALLWYDGYLWSGTSDGLIQWDTATSTYTWFQEEDGLASDWVTALAVDDEGIIHIGTLDQGVSRYNPKTKEWKSPFTIENSGLGFNSVSEIVNDGVGNMWYGSSGVIDVGSDGYVPNNGVALSRYRPETGWTNFGIFDDSLPGNSVGSLATNGLGNIWIVPVDYWDLNSQGIARYDIETNNWITFTAENSVLITNNVTSIAVDGEKIWIGTSNGLNSFDLATTLWETFTNESTNGGLIDNDIGSVAVDSSGNVWIGYNGLGVNKFEPKRNVWSYPPGQTVGVLQSMAPGDNGEVWFGAWHRGIYEYSATGTWRTLRTNSTLPIHAIHDITIDSSGKIWFAGAFGDVMSFDPLAKAWNQYPPDVIYGSSGGVGVSAIATNSLHNNDMWVAHWSRGVSNFRNNVWTNFNTANSGLPSNYVQAIAVTPDDTTWFGTWGEGLSRLKDGNWSSPITASTSGLINNSINALAIGFDNDIWIGTDEGVNRYYPDTPTGQQWERFTKSNSGLNDNFVKAIAVDKKRRQIWFGFAGFKYISRYSPDLPLDKQWKTFNVSADDFWIAPTGEIWLASFREACKYDPELLGDIWQCLHKESGTDPPGSASIAVTQDDVLWFGNMNGLKNWEIPYDSDLQMLLTGPHSVINGNPADHIITVQNIGKMVAENTILTVTLPTETIVRSLGTLNRDDATTITVPVVLNGNAGDLVTITATVATTSAESFLENNLAIWSTAIRSEQPDLRTVLLGPTSLTPNQPATFTVWVDNISGSGTTIQNLQVSVPNGFAQPNLGLDGMPVAFGQVISRTFVLDMPTNLSPNTYLSFAAQVAASAAEVSVTNNRSTVEIPTTASNIDTLFLVAGERMAQRSGHGASQVVNVLYELANKQLASGRQINGAVVDVQQASPDVAAAYRAWAAEPLSIAVANQVAQAIKNLLQTYATLYPNADTYVFVGGDDIIPFYRQSDKSSLYWPERRYFQNSAVRTTNTVRQSLNDNYFLTDDFYTDFAPQSPHSILWKDANRSYYVPKKASSRLVETPEEIIAAIDAFIANNGELTLMPMLTGADPVLTADSAQLLCQQVNAQTANACTLTSNPASFRDLIGTTNTNIVNSQHSNHRIMGLVDAASVHEDLINLRGKLLLSIGCHSGLNVPDSDNRQSLQGNADYDLMQAVLGNGGVAIAPTAYAYATFFKQPSYSEEFLLQLITQAQQHDGQTIGNLLMQTKAQFYTHRQQFLDSVDEKSAAAMTLYGLPMWKFKVTEASAASAVVSSPAVISAQIEQSENVSYSVQALVFDVGDAFDQPIRTNDGDYYSYNNQIFVSDLRPVQPRHTITITPLLPNGSIPHGVVLRRAEYREIHAHNPVIAVAQAIGEESVLPVEPAWNQQGWDWEEPYFLSNFDGDTAENPDSRSLASINLVLGAFNNDTKVERLYTRLVFDIYYSNSEDKTPPTVTMSEVVNLSNATVVTVTAADNTTQSVQTVALCHDSANKIQTSVALHLKEGKWVGVCPQKSNEVTIQVIDNAGNVLTTAPVQPIPTPGLYMFYGYLPIIMQRYATPRPDLIIEKVTATPEHLAVAFKNVGEASVSSDFWIEVCVDPNPIPTQVNQICKGLSYQYAMWGYQASQLPILPGERRQVYVDLNGSASLAYQSTLSHFDQPLSIGAAVYAHVDAANRDSCYGGVLEINEIVQQPPNCPIIAYNNIQAGIVTAAAETAAETAVGVQARNAQEVTSPQLPPLPDGNMTRTGYLFWLPIVTN